MSSSTPPLPASLSTFPVLLLSSPTSSSALLRSNAFPPSVSSQSFLQPLSVSLTLDPPYPLRSVSSHVNTLSSATLLLLTPRDLPSLNSYKEPAITTTDSELFATSMRTVEGEMRGEVGTLAKELESSLRERRAGGEGSGGGPGGGLSGGLGDAKKALLRPSSSLSLSNSPAPSSMFRHLSSLQVNGAAPSSYSCAHQGGAQHRARPLRIWFDKRPPRVSSPILPPSLPVGPKLRAGR